MELCLARAVRLGAVITCLMAVVVGSFITFVLASLTWASFRYPNPVWVNVVLILSTAVNPIAGAVGWRCSAGLSRFQQLTSASALTLAVALTDGLLTFVWAATPHM